MWPMMKKGMSKLVFKAALFRLLNDGLNSGLMDQRDVRDTIQETIREVGRPAD